MKYLSFVLFIFYIHVLTNDVNAQGITSKARKCRRAAAQGFQLEKTVRAEMCIFWSKEQKTFENAKLDCEAKGARLAVPKYPELLEILVKLNRNQPRHIWIGLDDKDTENIFIWHDRTIFEKKNYDKFWFPGEPNNYLDKEDCVLIWGYRQILADAECYRKEHYVCELV